MYTHTHTHTGFRLELAAGRDYAETLKRNAFEKKFDAERAKQTMRGGYVKSAPALELPDSSKTRERALHLVCVVECGVWCEV